MKPIPDELAARNPELYQAFVAWIEGSNSLQAAILQGDASAVEAELQKHGEALRAYMSQMRMVLAKHRPPRPD